MGKDSMIALVVVVFVSGCAGVFAPGGILSASQRCNAATSDCLTAAEKREEAAYAVSDEQQRQRDLAAIHATGERLERERLAALPDRLDRAMAGQAIDKVAPQVMACRDWSAATGRAVVRVKVAPDGHVVTIEIEGAPDDALGHCIATTLRAATFPKTKAGGSFRYPLVF